MTPFADVATNVIARVLVAAVLFGLAATVIVVDLSENVDCSYGEGIMDYGVAFAAVLAGLGGLVLTWTRRWRWLYAVGVLVLTFVLVTAHELAWAIGKCTS